MLVLTLLSLLRLQGSAEAPMPDVVRDHVAFAASIKELQLAVAEATAGTTIVLKNGQYHEPCVLKGKGSKRQPIVVRAETMGKVELQNQITIEGEYLSLIGFSFTGKGGINVKNGSGCRVSRCHMNNLKGGQWLKVDSRSRNVEIDHCLFEKKGCGHANV